MTLTEAAKSFLLAYLADGSIKQPSDLEQDILRVDPFDSTMLMFS